MTDATDKTHKSVFILAIAVLVFALFQFSQILIDRDSLGKIKDQLATAIKDSEKTLADNQKVLDQLNAVAIGTQRLADAGNKNAREIVDRLTSLGIRINPNFKEDAEKAKAAAPEAAAPVAAPPADK